MDKSVFCRENGIEHLKWNTLKREKSFTCPIFSIDRVERENPDGRKGSFVTLNSPDWIVVLPWFRDEDGVARFVMERQYRHGTDSVTVEFPAGLVEKGEEAEKAAKRELLEETGAEAAKWTMLGNVCPNSAFMNNRQSFFLAEGLEIVSGQDLDPNEQIDVISVPVSDVIRDMGTGLYDNGIMMMALGFFLRLSAERKDLL
jgi:NUDIX domain.